MYEYFINAKLTIRIKEKKDDKVFFNLSSRHFYICMLVCLRIPCHVRAFLKKFTSYVKKVVHKVI